MFPVRLVLFLANSRFKSPGKYATQLVSLRTLSGQHHSDILLTPTNWKNNWIASSGVKVDLDMIGHRVGGLGVVG